MRRARLDWPFGTIPGASDMPLACSARWYTWLRPKAASLGVSDLGAISSPLREVEIAPRSPTPRDASAGRSHVYQRAEHAKGISLAPGIVPKGQSRRARRPAAHRHQTLKADFGRLLARCHVAVSGEQSGPTGRSTPIHDAQSCLGGGNGCGRGQHAGRCQRVIVANTPLRVWLVGERIQSISSPTKAP